MKFLITTCFIFLILFARGENLPVNKLCDFTKLIAGAKNTKDKNERWEYYTLMLGVVSKLSNYRTQFVEDGNLVNLFPTVYYHTTCLEMEKIRLDSFSYPVEKMRQMLYFFFAYSYNRSNYDLHLSCEPHWQKHFDEIDHASDNPEVAQSVFCNQVRQALNAAIRAHLKYDLPRAIRYAYNARTERSITPETLRPDFTETNSLFAGSQILSIADIKIKHGWCGFVSSFPLFVNSEMLGAISTQEIIEWRTQAFQDAMDKTKDIPGYGQSYLIPQPADISKTALFKSGKTFCSSAAEAQNDGRLGAQRLFDNIHTIYHCGAHLNDAEKKEVFLKLNLKFDGNSGELFHSEDYTLSSSVDCSIDVIDLNHDGISEILIKFPADELFGQSGIEVIYSRIKNSSYEQVINFAGNLEFLITKHFGYPDLLLTGAENSWQIFRWEKSQYSFSETIETDQDIPPTVGINNFCIY